MNSVRKCFISTVQSSKYEYFNAFILFTSTIQNVNYIKIVQEKFFHKENQDFYRLRKQLIKILDKVNINICYPHSIKIYRCRNFILYFGSLKKIIFGDNTIAAVACARKSNGFCPNFNRNSPTVSSNPDRF